MTKQKYEKVIEWKQAMYDGKPFTDENVLKIGVIFMIPIIGQILFFIAWRSSLNRRNIYYRKVKEW